MPSLSQIIAGRLGTRGAAHRRIALGFALVSAFVFVGKLVGAGKEMLIAWHFGVGPTVDAYAFLLNVLTWPSAVAVSVLSAVLVPLFTRLRQADGAGLRAFTSELQGLTLIVAAVLWALAAFALPAAFAHGLPGMSGAMVQAADPMFQTLAWVAPASLLASLFSAWTLACGRHSNTLLEAAPAAVIIAALALAPSARMLVLGTAAGFIVQAAWLAVLLRRHGALARPRFGFRSPAWRDLAHGIGVMVAGQVIMSFATIVDQLLAAQVGAGGIATLSYANRLLMLVLGMGAIAISRATMPVFADAAHDSRAVHAMAGKWVTLMFVLGVAVAAAGWVLAEPGVRLLFERGAFGPANTAAVARTLRYALAQVPFYFAGLVLVSLLSSLRLYAWIAAGAAVNLAVKLVLGWWLVTRHGLPGLVLSTAAMYGLSMAWLAWVARRTRMRAGG